MPAQHPTSRRAGDEITISLDPHTRSRLEDLAREANRSPEDVAADAIREHVARHCNPTLGTDRAVPPPKGG